METTERKERSTLDRWGGGVPRFPRVKKKSHELFEIRGLLFQSVIFSYSNGRHRSMNRAWIARGFLSVIGRWSDSSGKRKYRDLLSLSLSLVEKERIRTTSMGDAEVREGERKWRGVEKAWAVRPMFPYSRPVKTIASKRTRAWMLLVNGTAKRSIVKHHIARRRDRAWQMMDPPSSDKAALHPHCVSSDPFNDESFSSGAVEEQSISACKF